MFLKNKNDDDDVDDDKCGDKNGDKDDDDNDDTDADTDADVVIVDNKDYEDSNSSYNIHTDWFTVILLLLFIDHV